MFPENELDAVRNTRGGKFADTGMSAVRVALLFGSAAVALALIVAPIADRQSRNYLAQAGGLDRMATGSIDSKGYGASYTIRKSVLQRSPDSVCLILANGRRSGEC